MTDKEVMQQALDALKNPSGNCKFTNAEYVARLAAITALKNAITQPVPPDAPAAQLLWGKPTRSDLPTPAAFGHIDTHSQGMQSLFTVRQMKEYAQLKLQEAQIAQPVQLDTKLLDYINRNYPDAKGETLTEKVIDALETMDIALGMTEVNQAQPVQPAAPIQAEQPSVTRTKKVVSEFTIADLAIEHLGSYAEKDYNFAMSILNAAAIAQPVQPVQPKDVDWQSVGKLIEANDRAKSLGFMPGTSNWGSMLWKAIVQPLQPTLTDQQVANMSEKHHREGLAEWSQPVQPTEPIGCVGKDGCTILYFTSELLPFETDLYIHPPA